MGQKDLTSVLDEGTAEGLLDGRIDPWDAPPGYGRVAEVLLATRSPARRSELLFESEARSAFAAHVKVMPAGRVGLRRTRRTLVLASLAALSLAGTALAGTGALPGPAQRFVHDLVDNVGISVPNGRGAGTASNPGPSPGEVGRCNAYSSGEGGSEGAKLDATSFQTLAAAAGGKAKVSAYCELVLAQQAAANANGGADNSTATTNPNARGGNPNANGGAGSSTATTNPNTKGGNPNANGGAGNSTATTNPNARGGNPNANGGAGNSTATTNPNARGGNPNANGGNPNANGGNPNADGGNPTGTT